jgi:CheY-like chemotaxis protein
MNGLEATRRLRVLPAFQDVPVIVLSASVSVGDEEESVQAGANAFVVKPVERGRLLAQIANLLHFGLIYEATPSRPASDKRDTSELIAPPEDEIRTLYHLARIGNMQDILRLAARLDELDKRYRPFANHLRGLAKGYQSRAILDLAQNYLNRKNKN